MTGDRETKPRTIRPNPGKPSEKGSASAFPRKVEPCECPRRLYPWWRSTPTTELIATRDELASVLAQLGEELTYRGASE